MISILTTNVFPGSGALKLLAKNLSLQTCKEFEWVVADCFFLENRDLIKDLAEQYGLKETTHVPACLATHIGRTYHWEIYNTALLVSKYPTFLRLGVYRYFHHQLVETVLNYHSNKTWVNLVQRPIDGISYEKPHAQIVEEQQLDVTTTSWSNQLVSSCGMFSYDKSRMIELGGNNESLVLLHWEDIDLNCRWAHLNMNSWKCVSLDKAFLRIFHDKGVQYSAKPHCRHRDYPRCIAFAENCHELKRCAPEGTKWFDHRGFPYGQCPVCRTLVVGNCDDYFNFLKTDGRNLYAPVGVGGVGSNGVGRDIRILNEDLNKLSTLESKLELLSESNASERYVY